MSGVLGRSHRRADVAVLLASELVVLLASELVTSSGLHRGSAIPGGLMTVTVAACDEGVWVEVSDRSGDGVRVLKAAAACEAEGGRGMQLVDGRSYGESCARPGPRTR